MADHPARRLGFRRGHLVGYSFLKTEQLVIGKRAQKTFQQDHRFTKTSIQIVVADVHGGPQGRRLGRCAVGRQIFRSLAEIVAKIREHFTHGGNLAEELRALRKQDAAQKGTHQRGAMRPGPLEVLRIERGHAGYHSIMLGVLFQRTEKPLQMTGEAAAQSRSYVDELEGFGKSAAITVGDGFIQRNAEHRVAGFEFPRIFPESQQLGVWQPAIPIGLNGSTQSCAIAVFQAGLPGDAGGEHIMKMLEQTEIYKAHPEEETCRLADGERRWQSQGRSSFTSTHRRFSDAACRG